MVHIPLDNKMEFMEGENSQDHFVFCTIVLIKKQGGTEGGGNTAVFIIFSCLQQLTCYYSLRLGLIVSNQ